MSIITLQGKAVDFSKRSQFVTIIGSRRASQSELDMAFNLARDYARRGKIVISGMADGVDTQAHLGALSVEGDHPKTIAILSTSPDEPVYPRSNSELSERIKRYGALMYCYKTIAPWTDERFGPKQKRLVERDVLQACLSDVIYVVSNKSYITGGSRWALNYARFLGHTIYRVSSNGKIVIDPPFKVEPRLISWSMELDWRKAWEEISSNQYNLIS